MRKVALAWMALAVIGLLGAGAVLAATKGYQLKIKNMVCDKCAKNVEKALRTIDGVEVLAADLEKKTVKLKINEEKASLDQVKKTLADIGYEVTEVQPLEEGT